MSDSDNELEGFYTIKKEKYEELVKHTERTFWISTDVLQDAVVASLPQEWEETPIFLLMEFCTTIRSLRSHLAELVKPSKNLQLIAKKNNITEILLTKENLATLNILLLSSENLEKRLMVEEKIVFSVN